MATNRAKKKPIPVDSTAAAKLIVSRVKLADLHHDPSNSRTHDSRNLATIKASLLEFGQVEPLVVQASRMRVVGGNGRLTTMLALGWTEADVTLCDLTDIQAAALAITLNRSAELAGWDNTILTTVLRSLESESFNFDSIGFWSEELGKLCGDLGDAALASLPDLSNNELHRITITYTLDDEDAIRSFVGQTDIGPLSPNVGSQILERIKDLATA